MTLGAHVQVNILADRGFRLDDIATAAGRCNLFILGMNFWFHLEIPSVVRHRGCRKGRASYQRYEKSQAPIKQWAEACS